MKTFACVLGVCFCLNFGLVPVVVAQAPVEKYLAATDIEKVTGMKGVRLIPRGSVAGASGDLNFADASGELVLMVQFTEARNYAGFKSKYAKGAIAGVGEEAIQGAIMPGMPANLLAFRKGTHCVVLTAFADFVKNRVYMTMDQLTELGKLIASRL